VVDVEHGIVYDVQNIPAWTEVPLKDWLEARYGCPVAINNDANCFALGEHRFGAGQGHDAMIGLILGTGFAGGIIMDGALYSGHNCGAGEFGTMPYRDSILEHYCAGLFFQRTYGISGFEAFQRAEAGDAEAQAMFAEMGQHLGRGLQMVLYAYDPSFIVFGGSVRHAFPYFSAAMWDALDDFAFPRSVDRLTIAVSDLDHAAILGAAALVDPSLSAA
jgi:glucokinase